MPAPHRKPADPTLSFLVDGSEMAGRIREFDGSAAALGAPPQWPSALRSSLRLALTMRQPALVLWGPALVCFYNDAFAAVLGPDKHPAMLGRPGREALAEAWPILGAEFERVLSGGPATWHENQRVPMPTHGRLEDACWTYSCTGVDDDTAPHGIGGVLLLCTETTALMRAAEHAHTELQRLSERQAGERSLAVSEEQFRLALEAGEVGLWDVDPVANTLFWPPAVRQMFGVFSDRPVSLHDDFYLGLHPDDRERTSLAYAKAYDPDARAVYDVEYRTVGHDDGLIRWVAAKGRGIFDEAGRCIRVIGTAIDITARKRDQARLEELNDTLERRLTEYLAERKLLSDIVEESDTLIQVLDLDFKVLAINRACADEFERLYRVRPKVGDSLLDILHDQPEQRELVRAIWQQSFESDGFVAVREFGDASLRKRAYEMHFRPYFDDQRRRLGAYQFVYDVTERLEAETRLARTEAALLQAKKMEAVGLLTGGIAHDFNNLLQAVSTTFELIRRKPAVPEKVVEWAAGGVDVAKRGARLTAQLLTFSRHQEPDIRPVQLKALLADLEDLLRTTVGPTVRVSVACDEVCVNADATQLEMALLNIAVNARDAMPSGGEFSLRCRALTPGPAELPPGDYVELQLADTGCGMPADVALKAFEPFFTTKAIGKGSGLGLSQVYGMARRAGGTVRIDSDGATGTTLVIVLRRATTVPMAGDDAVKPQDKAVAGGSARVLVIDDDPHVRQSVVESVRELGHEAIEAADGDAGLGLLRQHDIDVVMVDYAMPVMDGATFARLARAERPHVPVILMSGYSDADAIRSAVGQSAALLRKPFNLETLRRAIAAAIAAGIAAAAARQALATPSTPLG